jgi:ABC-type uncharacterized transport system ATPase subunit
MNDKPIVIEDLVKFYDGRCVLDGVSLEVPRGCIYGLLGRNGSGKTTMIRILLGLEPPTQGRTLVLGEDSPRLSASTHGRIGYVAEGHHLIQSYKVRRLIALCKGLSLHWNDKFFGQLMETFRLPLDRKVKDLSTGMRAQLNLALAMAIDPELVILDDPTLAWTPSPADSSSNWPSTSSSGRGGRSCSARTSGRRRANRRPHRSPRRGQARGRLQSRRAQEPGQEAAGDLPRADAGRA